MDATQYIAMARRWWWLLIVGTLMAVGAYGVAVQIRDGRQAATPPPAYSASATFLVDAPALTTNIDRLTQSYVAIISGRGVAERMVASLGLPIAPEAVQSRITVETPPGSQLIKVTTKGATPADAQRLVDGVAQAFLALRQEGNLPGTVAMVEVNRAQQLAVPEPAQNIPQNAMLVAILGMMGAAAIVVAFEYMTDAVRDRAEAERASGVPSLGSIPVWNIGGGAMRALAVTDGSASPVAERFRMLRTTIGLATREVPAQAILVAGGARGTGTSTIAANMAGALAQAGRRVAILDANMRVPSLHRIFGIASGAGLSDALTNTNVTLDSIIRPTPADGVMLVPAGAAVANAADLLDSPRFDAIMRALRERFDAIVVDSPPVLQVTDATVLAAKCDATILVARGDHTRRSELAATVEVLRPATTRVLGVVLNGDANVPGGGFFGFRVPAPRRERTGARA